MVPSVRGGADQSPEGYERFDPTSPLDPADVDRPGPSELLQDADHLLLRGRIVPGDQHLRSASDELRVDHLRVGDRVEGFYDLRSGQRPLHSFGERVVEPDEQAGVRSAGELERVLHVDDDFAHEVLRPREARDLVERGSARRDHDRLTVSCGLLERPGRGFPLRPFQPRRESLALRAPRAHLHTVSPAHKAGTPLVKSEGMEVVRQLKKSFPGKTIVADLKTMDTGAFEVEIAAKAGADVITVMGVTDDATILEAVRAARRYGSKIMVDLMRVADKPTRAKELEKLGVDYLNMHVSIDEQMIAHTPLQELKAVAAATSLPVAVAGGLNSETVGQALKAGTSIVIVGGAIIKAEDVAGATRTIKKAILQRKSIPTGLYK